MADAYGNVINAPGTTEKGAVEDPELLFSFAGLLQKGVTLKGGQGVLTAGTPLELSSGLYVKSGSASTVTKGFLRTGVDTGTSAEISAPVQSPTATATSGGTLAAATYFYVVTAINALGETVASNEKSQATTGSTSTVTVSWAAVSGATGYKVYRSTSTGAEVHLADVAAGTETYTDTGSDTPGSATPPASNTTGGTTVTPVRLGNIVLAGVVKKSLVDAANGAALSNSQKTALGGVVVDSEFGFYRF